MGGSWENRSGEMRVEEQVSPTEEEVRQANTILNSSYFDIVAQVTSQPDIEMTTDDFVSSPIVEFSSDDFLLQSALASAENGQVLHAILRMPPEEFSIMRAAINLHGSALDVRKREEQAEAEELRQRTLQTIDDRFRENFGDLADTDNYNTDHPLMIGSFEDEKGDLVFLHSWFNHDPDKLSWQMTAYGTDGPVQIEYTVRGREGVLCSKSSQEDLAVIEATLANITSSVTN